MIDCTVNQLNELKEYFGVDSLAKKVYHMVGDSPIAYEEIYGAVIVKVFSTNDEIIVTPTIPGSQPYLVRSDMRASKIMWESIAENVPNDKHRRFEFYDPSVV